MNDVTLRELLDMCNIYSADSCKDCPLIECCLRERYTDDVKEENEAAYNDIVKTVEQYRKINKSITYEDVMFALFPDANNRIFGNCAGDFWKVPKDYCNNISCFECKAKYWHQPYPTAKRMPNGDIVITIKEPHNETNDES